MQTRALVVKRPAPIARRPLVPLAFAPLAVIATGVWWMTLLAPLSLFTLVIAATCIAIGAASPGGMSLRSLLEEQRNLAERRDRREQRESRLPLTSFGRETLAELTRLVDITEMRDHELAMRIDLEGLLDRHVTLTLAYERALESVRLGDREQLTRMREGYRSDPESNPARLDLCERRLKLVDESQAKADALADELAILSDTIRLIAQRATMPADPDLDDVVERQLEALDGDVAARGQVAQLG